MKVGSQTIRRVAIAACCITGVGISAESGIVAIGAMVLGRYRNGDMSATDAAPFGILAGSAVAGIVVVAITFAALTRVARYRPAGTLAKASSLAAWIRMLAVLVAVAVALAIGPGISTELSSMGIICFTISDAAVGVGVTHATSSLGGPGSV
nr:hypothetical protein [uncultured Actinoplanes sp.]